MNLSPRWVPHLEQAGITAMHWSTLGSPAATDQEIMAHARTTGAIVLTHDLDFTAILAATGGDKPSVAQIRAHDVNPVSIGKQVIKALLQCSEELASGAILSVDPARTRIKLLPIKGNV